MATQLPERGFSDIDVRIWKRDMDPHSRAKVDHKEPSVRSADGKRLSED